MSESEYQPGTYVKGDVERVAHTASDAVALRFDGYTLKKDAPAPSDEKPSEPEQAPEQPEAVEPGAAPESARPRPPKKKD